MGMPGKDGNKKMIEKPLNRAQAEALFSENAVLIGKTDVIEKETAVKLLGEDAYNFAIRNAKTRAVNGYGIGHFTMSYITEEAFYLGITYLNVDAYRRKKMEKADA